ncbi:MAG: hypothetical protein INR63_14605, partial [Actinomycetospora chiangmaiensis]|nr:hypothetical protein [Actinomycetospora chiangmaiensis]
MTIVAVPFMVWSVSRGRFTIDFVNAHPISSAQPGAAAVPRILKIPIALKIAFAFAFIAANSIGYLWYISQRMVAADAAYTAYLENDATAATMAARLGRVVYQMSYVAFRTL